MDRNNKTCAVDLINQGASLIAIGNYNDAISVLRKAHASAKLIKSGNRRDERTRLKFEESLDLWVSQTPDFDNDNDGSDGDDHGFICKQPIHVPVSVRDNVQQHHAAITVSIIFNLALAHHLLGLVGNDKSITLLSKAVKFYEYSFQIYQGQAGGKELKLENTQFLMVSINNSGQCHRALGRDQSAASCFQELLSTLVLLKYFSRDSRSRYPSFAETLCEGFFRNISRWVSRENLVAAGAA